MKIAVTGCGWFGLSLARSLKQKGYNVVGSKRDSAACASLAAEGIEAVPLTLPREGEPEAVHSLVDVDAMVINIPPGLRRGDNDYLDRLASLKSLLIPGRIKKLIFISTTGVYPNTGKVTEFDAAPHSAVSETLLAAESMFGEGAGLLAENGQCCVVRFAGLVGPGRHPGRFLAGKLDVKGGNQTVNLVHLDDCVAGVTRLLESDTASGIYNLCAPEHLSKKVFYSQAALALGLPAPQFAPSDIDESSDKIVVAERIVNELEFVYQHPELLPMLSAC